MKCSDCGKSGLGVKMVRSAGKPLCGQCAMARRTYNEHWMVKSLRYNKPGLPGVKARKPLDGQMELPI